jgi:SAM-dependent methyltransferase
MDVLTMAEINLMDKYPRSKRPIEERGAHKLAGYGSISINTEERTTQEIYMEQLLLQAVRKFDREYFDGDRLYGYGGYHYDPRFWTATVKRLKNHYRLAENASVLDVGCAKGFLLHDFKLLMPGLRIAGLDISRYAYENALSDVKPFITVGNALKLPYPDKSFDLVISINTVDHLPLEDCKKAVQEIQRVAKKHSFIMVNAWKTAKQKDRLLKWNHTALTALHVTAWKKLFKESGYKGDFYWFFAE